jgi:hypothetical protein
MLALDTAFVEVACWRSCKWCTPQMLLREANDAHDNRRKRRLSCDEVCLGQCSESRAGTVRQRLLLRPRVISRFDAGPIADCNTSKWKLLQRCILRVARMRSELASAR